MSMILMMLLMLILNIEGSFSFIMIILFLCMFTCAKVFFMSSILYSLMLMTVFVGGVIMMIMTISSMNPVYLIKSKFNWLMLFNMIIIMMMMYINFYSMCKMKNILMTKMFMLNTSSFFMLVMIMILYLSYCIIFWNKNMNSIKIYIKSL